MSARPTPLLTAFRLSRAAWPVAAAGASGGLSEFAIQILAVLLPVAVFIYLSDLEPLAAIKTVEFTHPDLIVILLLLVLLARAARRGFPSFPKTFLIPVVLFFVATTLSAVLAADKLRAIAAVVQMVEFVVLAWCVSLITSRERGMRVIHFLLAFFAFEALLAVWQFIIDEPYSRGTFLTNQKYSMFMGCGAAICFALSSSATTRLARFFYFALMLVLLGGALVGQERAPWLAFIIAGMGVSFFSGKRRKHMIIGLLAAAVIAVAIVAYVPRLRERTVSRIAEVEIESEKKNTLLSRLAVWGVALQLFRDHPIVGVGPKNFVSLVPSLLSSDEMGGLEAADPHNVWLGILAEGGIIGFVTYLYLCYAILRLAFHKVRDPRFESWRPLLMAYLAYHFFWFAMSLHYFTKGEGHIHFMMIGLLLGVNANVVSSVPPPSQLAVAASR